MGSLKTAVVTRYTLVALASIGLFPADIEAHEDRRALSKEQVLAELLHPQRPTSSHEAAAQDAWVALDKFDAEDQIEVLRQVAEHGPSETSVVATGQLVLRQRAADMTQVIVRRLKDDPSGSAEAGLLHLILRTEQASELAAIPRYVLRRRIHEKTPYRHDPGDVSPVDLAAMLLRDTGRREDHALLREAALAFPESPDVWHALAWSDALEPPQEALAASLLQNRELGPRLRTAVAVALAPRHADAEAIAIQQLRDAIEACAPIDVTNLVFRFGNGDEEAMQRYMRYRDSFRLVPMLRTLRSDTARDLAALALRAQNLRLRILGSLIAAERWPRWLLERPDHALTDEELNGALAFIAYLHPALADEAKAHSPDADAFDVMHERMLNDRPNSATLYIGEGGAFTNRFFPDR